MKIEVNTTTPIAQMNEEILEKFVKGIYTNKMARACRLLVERIKDYR